MSQPSTARGGPRGACEHAVQFYDRDDFLFETVGDYVARALTAGTPALVIATRAHGEGFAHVLRAKGFDVEALEARGQLTHLDARATLDSFMVGEMPDAGKFLQHVGAAVERCAARRAPGTSPSVYAYGEMVDLLWKDGKPQAAIRLEELWNDLAREHSFSLLCAYTMASFYREQHVEHFDRICRNHTQVIPTESATKGEITDPLREFARVQQRALALENEVRGRRELEGELRQALRDRRRCQEELEDFFDNAPVALHWVDAGGIVVRANKAELELLGYSRDEVVGHHVREFHADSERVDEILDRLARGETLDGYEARLRRKDGSIRHVLISSNALFENGQFVHTRCYTNDITDRKRAEAERAALAAEKARRDSAARKQDEDSFRLLVESVKDYAIFVLDPQGHVLTWNAGAERLKGYRAEEILGKHFSIFYPREKVNAGFPEEELRLAARDGRFEDEGPRFRKDGTRFIANVVITALHGDDGALRGFAKVTRDVTERFTSAEKELRSSEIRYRTLFENTLDAIMIVDDEGRFVDANDSMCRVFKLSRDRLIGGRFTDLLAPESLERAKQSFGDLSTKGFFEGEFPIRASDGTVVELEWKSRAHFLPGLHFCVARDVTRRKRAERALRESEERLRLAAGTAELGVFEWNVPNDEALWENDRLFEIFGRTSEDGPLTKAEFYRTVLHRDDRDAFERAMTDAMKPGRRFEEVCRIWRKDGELRWIQYSARFELAEDGTALRLVGVVKDITDEKRVADALRVENQTNERLLRVGKAFASELHQPNLVQIITDEATKLCGAEFGAFFHNVKDENGESYTLYTIAGVPRERFANFPLPRNTALFDPTFRGEGTIRIRDVKEDPRHGKNAPYHGMPRGHLPVRSYLAVPVKTRTGDVIGGLFFGHSTVGVFTEEHERLIDGLAAQASVALDNSRLYADLRRSEDRLLVALDATGLGTFDHDLVTGRVRWDEKCKALFGLPPDAVVDFDVFLSRVHADDRQRVREQCQKAFDPANGRQLALEYRTVGTKDVEERVISARGRLVCDPDGKPVRMVGAVLDVTDQKRGEQALRDADRRKDEFLAMLAHELRNPLAPITTALHLVRTRAGEREDLARPLAVMTRQTQHLSKLVDDLLEVSRITRGKIRLEREPLDACVAVNRAVEISRPLIDSKKHDLQVSVPHEPLWVHADVTRLSQVLGNLLNNAAKYTDEGGQIAVSVRREGTDAVFSVRDNGIGIPRELQPRLFELFTQADNSLDRSQGGLGIGLTLVRGLVELHGGSVKAESAGPGEGSEFTVRLPLASKPRRDDRGGSLDRHGGAARCRVVIVDDNLDAAESLAEFLTDGGHEVKVAHDGPSSLEAVRAHKPDVVFLDIGLPRLDGYAVARELRREHGACLTIVALTGYGQEEDRRRTKEAGFDHHLVKPVHLDALSKLLER